MYLRNHNNKKSYNKKLKQLDTSVYSKIKNKKLSSKKLPKEKSLTPQAFISNKTNEIEKYFLKKVGDVTRKDTSVNKSIIDDALRNNPNAESNENKKNEKQKQSEILNKYLDGSRITAFNNYLKVKEFTTFNASLNSEIALKNTNNLIKNQNCENSSTINVSQKDDGYEYTLDYLIDEFTMPFGQDKKDNLKKLAELRKELREAYELNFCELSPKENVITKVNSEVQTSFILNNEVFGVFNKEPYNYIQNMESKVDHIPNQQQVNTKHENYSEAIQKLYSDSPKNSFENLNINANKSSEVEFFQSNLKISKIRLEDLYYD